MKVGQVGWIDLTVDKAEELRDFYASVIGWTPSPVDMDGYFDYSMKDPHGDDVAGVCHPNKWSVPETLGRWIPYFVVADMDASLAKCADLGGKVLTGPHAYGEGKWCAIQDRQGVVCALYWAGE